MNRQYSYNNFDYKYMHKGQLLFCYTYFCVDGLLTFPKPERVEGRQNVLPQQIYFITHIAPTYLCELISRRESFVNMRLGTNLLCH